MTQDKNKTIGTSCVFSGSPVWDKVELAADTR